MSRRNPTASALRRRRRRFAAQPYRKGSAPSVIGRAIRSGTTLFGQNHTNQQRAFSKRVRTRSGRP